MRGIDLASRPHGAGAGAVALAIAVLCGGLDPAWAAEDETPLSGYSVVHGFVLSEGAGPLAGVVQGRDGHFYGTTLYGSSKGNGIVFRLSPKGKLEVLHAFRGDDGLKPASGLAVDRKGALFGLTSSGGKSGGGTAFKITADGAFTLLHSFGGKSNDGAQAMYGSLALGSDGNFYGAQSTGGAKGFGTVFKMSPAGAVTVLHAFKGGPSDGARPLGGLVLGADGNFYGTTQAGGANDPGNEGGGTLYRMTAAGTFEILFDFAGGASHQVGREPQSAPVIGDDGWLYGVTPLGGRGDFGTVYRVKKNGSGFETLHAFRGGVRAQARNGDGATPVAQLLLARNGSLYGTSYEGGPNDGPVGTGGGTIFKIDRHGTYSRLHALGEDSEDAALPIGALTQSEDGHLYGTTWAGGPQTLRGTVFQIAP
jgi:uncharacterized repeat protein (TIGR03803 family)